MNPSYKLEEAYWPRELRCWRKILKKFAKSFKSKISNIYYTVFRIGTYIMCANFSKDPTKTVGVAS